MGNEESLGIGWMLTTYGPAMLLLLVVSAFFSASEAALFSLSWTQRKKLNRSKTSDDFALTMLDQPDKLLSAILFWNLTVNMAYFAVSGAVSSRLAQIPAGEKWAPTFAIGSMILIILFGELVPKSVGVIIPLALVRVVAIPMHFLVRFVNPITALLRAVSEFSRRLLWPGLTPEKYLDVNDLEQAIELSTEDGNLIAQEKAVLRNIIQLSSVRADEWMLPRSQFPTFASHVSIEELEGQVPQGGYLLITDRDKREIQSAIHLTDLTHRFANEPEKLRQPVLVVPWCAPLATVLQRMIRQNRHVAIVVNEHGETVGLLTYEDIIVATFDTIHNRWTSELTRPSVTQTGERQWEVTGTTSLRRLERALAEKLPAGAYLTVAGVIHEQLRRLAVTGDVCLWGEFRLEVIDSPRRGEMLVRITKQAATERTAQ
jgi:putative hemolysin